MNAAISRAPSRPFSPCAAWCTAAHDDPSAEAHASEYVDVTGTPGEVLAMLWQEPGGPVVVSIVCEDEYLDVATGDALHAAQVLQALAGQAAGER
ncbi:MAG: hypothetical protein ACYCVZ_05220 [Streptosporangiaceae bacterium]